jgi:hypothetical protein
MNRGLLQKENKHQDYIDNIISIRHCFIFAFYGIGFMIDSNVSD